MMNLLQAARRGKELLLFAFLIQKNNNNANAWQTITQTQQCTPSSLLHTTGAAPRLGGGGRHRLNNSHCHSHTTTSTMCSFLMRPTARLSRISASSSLHVSLNRRRHHHHHAFPWLPSSSSSSAAAALQYTQATTVLRASNEASEEDDHHHDTNNDDSLLQSTQGHQRHKQQQRPVWALDWMPTLLVTLGFPGQFALALTLYLFHATVLVQHQLVFPFQLWPNRKGHFTGIGWDSIAGMLVLVGYSVLRRCVQQKLLQQSSSSSDDSSSGTTTSSSAMTSNHHRDKTNKNDQEQDDTLPSLWSAPTRAEMPWHLPAVSVRHRLTSIVTAAALMRTYFKTGQFSLFWEDLIYNLSGLGFAITAPMERSLCVLLGHLSWLVAGTLLLKWLPRPPKFFGRHAINAPSSSSSSSSPNTDIIQTTNDDNNEASSQQKPQPQQRQFCWFQSSRNSYWLWWAIGGYFVSSWLFNMADLLNHLILPASVLEGAQESIVTQLVNPENNELAASLVGYIAPCLTAPWWEEVLYRGFALAGLTQLFGYPWAVFLQGVVFSAHHMSLTAALPLAVLGWTWAVLYTKSRNLWTVIIVHSLWNSRVFLGSWFGL